MLGNNTQEGIPDNREVNAPGNLFAEQGIIQELTHDQVAALQEGTTRAVTSSMGIVREGQWDKAGMEVQSKGEGVVTRYDFKSEDNGRTILRNHGGGMAVLGEERGLSRDETAEPDPRLAGLEGRIVWVTDMLDGSRPFANGAGTSTVICTAWDKLARRFVATTIGHPQSGLVMEASNGQTVRWRVNLDTGERTEPIPCRVWAGDLGGESSPTILIENLQSFQKADGRQGGDKRTVFSLHDLLRLQHEVSDHMALQNMGSNGWHYMMLAGIGERVAAMVTTSIGNPGDVAGIHLAENAGAAVRVFHVNSDRQLELVKNTNDIIHDPEHPSTVNGFDIVVAGVNTSVADFTADALVRTFNRRLGITI